jgi:endoglucanase
MFSAKSVLSVVILSVFPLFALSPVGTHGTLKVSGVKIIGAKDNEPVQLAGMSMFWSLWEGEKFYNKKVVEWLVQDWNITVIRAALGVGVYGGYDSDDANTSKAHVNRVKTIVDAAIANGIYVIVDYHAHHANTNIFKAKEFFSEMAQEYGTCPNVIWEIWNEPDLEKGTGLNGRDTWEDIRNYASEVIPIIRKYSENLIIVGTPYWSQAVDSAALNPIADSNVAYTLHFYAGSHKDSLRQIAQNALDLGAPLFITEFGLSIADGGSDGTIDSVETKIWLDWADSNGISWVNWSIVDKGESSAALIYGASAEGGWTEDVLSNSGKWIRNRLRARPAYEYTDIIPSDGKSLPGIIEAESFIAKSEELKLEQTSDVGGGENLAYTTNGSWAEYTVNVRIEGEYTARLRVAADANFGGTINLKFNNTNVASWNISSTGGWQSWITTDSCQKFFLPKGETKLRVEWSGTASSLINLNWIEFKNIQEPISIKNQKSHFSKDLPNFRINNGKIYFFAKEPAAVMMLSASGRVIFRKTVKSGVNEIPLGKGLHLLRLKRPDGFYETFKIIGAIK